MEPVVTLNMLLFSPFKENWRGSSQFVFSYIRYFEYRHWLGCPYLLVTENGTPENSVQLQRPGQMLVLVPKFQVKAKQEERQEAVPRQLQLQREGKTPVLQVKLELLKLGTQLSDSAFGMQFAVEQPLLDIFLRCQIASLLLTSTTRLFIRFRIISLTLLKMFCVPQAVIFPPSCITPLYELTLVSPSSIILRVGPRLVEKVEFRNKSLPTKNPLKKVAFSFPRNSKRVPREVQFLKRTGYPWQDQDTPVKATLNKQIKHPSPMRDNAQSSTVKTEQSLHFQILKEQSPSTAIRKMRVRSADTACAKQRQILKLWLNY